MKHILFVILSVLVAGVSLGAQDKPYLEDLSYYVENLSVFGQGQEPPRAYHIPEHHLSLNGTWKFGYYECPSEVPKDFYLPGFNDRKWGTITVPSNWEMQGYGQALFRNVSTPFPNHMPESLLAQYRKVLEDPAASEQEKRMARYRMGGGAAPALFSVATEFCAARSASR